jgi:hypothetical protein
MTNEKTKMQALCAEQLTELRGMFERILYVARSSGGPTVGNIQLADRLIDAVVSWSENFLAHPEPQKLTVQECNNMRKHGGNFIYESRDGKKIRLDGWFTRDDLTELALTQPTSEESYDG